MVHLEVSEPAGGGCYQPAPGPVILAVSKGPLSQLRYCLWYRSSHGTDFDISEIASPVHPEGPV